MLYLKIIEQNFAKNLKDPIWANDHQDMQEHWDVKGTLNNELLKFDVKGMKKVNRWDNKKQDDIELDIICISKMPTSCLT